MKKYLLLFPLFLCSCMGPGGGIAKVCDPPKVVTSIGICNKDAYCSVQYEDGSYGREDYPIVGKTGTNCRYVRTE